MKQKVSDFINDFEIEFQNIWKENCENESENGEAIEGVITKALYSKYFYHQITIIYYINRLILLYSPEKDRKIEKLFKIFDFIQLSHLECKQEVIITSSFEQALKRFFKHSFLKIKDFRSQQNR